MINWPYLIQLCPDTSLINYSTSAGLESIPLSVIEAVKTGKNANVSTGLRLAAVEYLVQAVDVSTIDWDNAPVGWNTYSFPQWDTENTQEPCQYVAVSELGGGLRLMLWEGGLPTDAWLDLIDSLVTGNDALIDQWLDQIVSHLDLGD